jgi:hypothetical protein
MAEAESFTITTKPTPNGALSKQLNARGLG